MRVGEIVICNVSLNTIKNRQRKERERDSSSNMILSSVCQYKVGG